MANIPRRPAGRPPWMAPIAARLTPTVKAIVVVLSTVYAFFLFVPATHPLLARLVIGAQVFREPWRLVTSLFVQFGPIQFIFSLIGLLFVGAYLERSLGQRGFLVLSLGSGILANLAVGSVAWLLGAPAGEIGCSLVVLAYFVAFGRVMGNTEVQVLPGVPELVFKARHLSTFWVLFAIVGALISRSIPYLAGVLVTSACGYVLARPGGLRALYEGFRTRRARQRYRVLEGGLPGRGKTRRDKYWN